MVDFYSFHVNIPFPWVPVVGTSIGHGSVMDPFFTFSSQGFSAEKEFYTARFLQKKRSFEWDLI